MKIISISKNNKFVEIIDNAGKREIVTYAYAVKIFGLERLREFKVMNDEQLNVNTIRTEEKR